MIIISYLKLYYFLQLQKNQVWSTITLNIVVDILDCSIVVSKFELQPCYYIDSQTNTLEKGMNPIIPTAIG